MSGSVNKVIIIGNLGADPETRQTGSGQSVATLSVATSRTYKDREGNRKEETEWHRVVVWGQLADFAQRYLGKGRKVYVEGRLQTRSWDDAQTGQKKYATEIVAETLTALDSGGDRGERRPEPAPASSPVTRPVSAARDSWGRQDAPPPIGDDCPF